MSNTGGPQLLLCTCILGTSAKQCTEAETEKTDGLHGIKEVIYVKLYPCTAGRVGNLQHLLWATYNAALTSLHRLVRSSSNSQSNCDSQREAGDSLSDQNSHLHWSNSHSNLELPYKAVRDNNDNDNIFKLLSNIWLCIEWAPFEIKILQ